MAIMSPIPKGSAWWLALMIITSLTRLTTPQRPPQQQPNRDCFASIDLLIILDSSGSVPFQSPYNWGTAKNLTKSYIDTLDVATGLVQVALIQVADHAVVRFHFSRYRNPEDMKREIDRLTVSNQGRTNLAEAFEIARTSVFTEENGDRPAVQNAVIFISDGVPTIRIDETIPEAERLKREKRVNIISFGISGVVNRTLLQRISTMDSQDIISFDEFDLTRNILMDQKVDICIAVDASGSINFLNPNNWFYAKQFLKAVINQLQVRTDGIRVGCVTFNDTATLHFNLGRYNDVQSISNAIDRLPYYGGKTNVAAGLRLCRTKVLELTGKFRTNRKLVTLVISDGAPTEEIDKTQIEADNLKRGGVHLVSVVVKGNAQINMTMLRNIASISPTGSDRTRRAIVQVTDYSSLAISTTSVLERICFDNGYIPQTTPDPNELICYNTCNPPNKPRGLPRGLYQYCESGSESILADCKHYLICDGPNSGNGNGNNNNRKLCGDNLHFDVVAQTCTWRSCTCPGSKRRCEIDANP